MYARTLLVFDAQIDARSCMVVVVLYEAWLFRDGAIWLPSGFSPLASLRLASLSLDRKLFASNSLVYR